MPRAVDDLELPRDPQEALHAATKQYVDAAVAAATGSSYVPVSNGDPDDPAYLFAPDGTGIYVEWP